MALTPLAFAAGLLIHTSSAGQVIEPYTFSSRDLASGAVSCEQLTTVRAPDLRVRRATTILPDPTWTIPHPRPGDPVAEIETAFCRVEATAEDEIDFELWLPLREAWNGRMLGTGNGGFAGFLRYDGLAHGLQRGFATLSTNTGHLIEEQNWSIGHPRRLENYGHRGQHLSAVNARVLIDAFYGRAPQYSYFMGCSGGGMQAINEVQRYPSDYDGVIAGAHGYSIAGISARWLESALIGREWPGTALSQEEWGMIARAGVAQCDGDDGVADGIISNPQSCSFRIADTPGLSPGKIATAERILGPVTGEDGRILFEGFLPGAEFTAIGERGRPGEFFGEWYYRDPDWDASLFDATRDVPLIENAIPGVVFSTPHIGAFARRGGKLISYQGWDDGIVPGEATIAYYQGVRDYLGEEMTDSFYRLFLAPGVDHCAGGVGADTFGQTFLAPSPDPATPQNDILLAMMRWVEEGIAPDQLEAAKVEDGKVSFSRPLCRFPAHPVYKGSGDPDMAENFTCETG
ncbi:tannase/feruloyl esterase family alpha/beta hydrolase [Aurantiacibacter poecillastricola]|uniref:tannase/feruloyl esterase family alpha/beta hydrolase n=1 Tax=Aurantiacibacter poecillastricola TaxID=3064385 RepID=UPI00273FD3BA|nr:tannase/feruloyl esterase family alpha/beta hydrolase [Aurantiacibacter sp. 219JJ12-13]MDP5261291.1 tannase/feruloyl esterase family alpha/beta hydrolase [Aurantiacibacter sp. 219JJ12-13]